MFLNRISTFLKRWRRCALLFASQLHFSAGSYFWPVFLCDRPMAGAVLNSLPRDR